MDFEFESKDDFKDAEDPVTPPAGDLQDEPSDFVDISSSSASENGENGVDIMSSSKNAKKKKHNRPRIIINVVTSVILAFSVLVTSAMGWFVANADTSIKDVPLLRWLFGGSKFDGIGYDDDGKVESGDFEKLKTSINENVTYFLVVGCDWTDTKQTDVIVVVCMDHKNKTCSMLQIPRDTYVGYANAYKINSVYPNAQQGELKINALRRCLSNQLGIPIDHYVLFSIKGAVNVVDAIGGVTMNLKNAIEIEDPLHFGKYYKIGPGKVRLKGRDAIGFVRKRYGNQSEDENYDGSDIGRVKQQRKFYAALFKELQTMSTGDIWRIANSCFNQVQTDLSLNETAAYALAAKDLKSKNIHIFGLPGQACYYNGVSYYSIHKDDYLTCFNNYFNPYGKKLTMDDIKMQEIYSIAGYAKNNNWLSPDDSTLEEY